MSERKNRIKKIEQQISADSQEADYIQYLKNLQSELRKSGLTEEEIKVKICDNWLHLALDNTGR